MSPSNFNVASSVAVEFFQDAAGYARGVGVRNGYGLRPVIN